MVQARAIPKGATVLELAVIIMGLLILLLFALVCILAARIKADEKLLDKVCRLFEQNAEIHTDWPNAYHRSGDAATRLDKLILGYKEIQTKRPHKRQ